MENENIGIMFKGYIESFENNFEGKNAIKYNSLIIKFLSSKKELGFVEYKNKNNGDGALTLSLVSYYYVVDARNKAVKSIENKGKMIKETSNKFKELNSAFSGPYKGTYYIGEDRIKTTK